MKEEIINKIVLHQTAINELKQIKKRIIDSPTDNVEFIVKTKEFNPWTVTIEKLKSKLNISICTMNLILDEAIKGEKEEIDRLIDLEVKKRLKK